MNRIYGFQKEVLAKFGSDTLNKFRLLFNALPVGETYDDDDAISVDEKCDDNDAISVDE